MAASASAIAHHGLIFPTSQERISLRMISATETCGDERGLVDDRMPLPVRALGVPDELWAEHVQRGLPPVARAELGLCTLAFLCVLPPLMPVYCCIMARYERMKKQWLAGFNAALAPYGATVRIQDRRVTFDSDSEYNVRMLSIALSPAAANVMAAEPEWLPEVDGRNVEYNKLGWVWQKPDRIRGYQPGPAPVGAAKV